MANFKYNYIQCGFTVWVILEKFIMSFKKNTSLVSKRRCVPAFRGEFRDQVKP